MSGVLALVEKGFRFSIGGVVVVVEKWKFGIRFDMENDEEMNKQLIHSSRTSIFWRAEVNCLPVGR